MTVSAAVERGGGVGEDLVVADVVLAHAIDAIGDPDNEWTAEIAQ